VDNLTQVTVGGDGTANRNIWEANYWSDYEGFDKDENKIGDKPYELYAYADRLWQDHPYAQFFKGSPMLEVLDFLERLAPFSQPDLLVRDHEPLLQAPGKLDVPPESKPAKSSLELLRESMDQDR